MNARPVLLIASRHSRHGEIRTRTPIRFNIQAGAIAAYAPVRHPGTTAGG